jgi:hypothetical protein
MEAIAAFLQLLLLLPWLVGSLSKPFVLRSEFVVINKKIKLQIKLL